MVAYIGRKRLASLTAGALLVLLAAWCYRLYDALSNDDTARLASVPRLQISDFKPFYDRARAFAALQGTTPALGRQGSDDALFVIDVRSSELYLKGHIRGAVSIPQSDLEARITSVVPPSRRSALIVLYCA